MNVFLDPRFDELVQRLAVGIEPVDAARSTLHTANPARWRTMPVSHPVEVIVESKPLTITRRPRAPRRAGRDVGDYWPLAERHAGYRHVLRYDRDLDTTATVDVRLVDHTRHFVPRRVRLPLAVPQPVPDPETTPVDLDVSARGKSLWRLFLYPGAAYDVTGAATGLRGRLLRGGAWMPWARVEARLTATTPGAGALVGRAHGDDRGEFLLLVDLRAGPVTDLDAPIDVELTVIGPPTAPAAPAFTGAPADPLWGLPLEKLTAPGWSTPDDGCAGIALPSSGGATPASDYTAGVRVTRSLRVGRLVSAEIAFDPPYLTIP